MSSETWTHEEIRTAAERWSQYAANLTRDLLAGPLDSEEIYNDRVRYGNNPRARVSDIRKRLRPRGWDIVVESDRRRGSSVYRLMATSTCATPRPTPPVETATQDDLFPFQSTAW